VLDAFEKKNNRRRKESFVVLSTVLLLNTESFCGATLCGSRRVEVSEGLHLQRPRNASRLGCFTFATSVAPHQTTRCHTVSHLLSPAPAVRNTSLAFWVTFCCNRMGLVSAVRRDVTWLVFPAILPAVSSGDLPDCGSQY